MGVTREFTVTCPRCGLEDAHTIEVVMTYGGYSGSYWDPPEGPEFDAQPQVGRDKQPYPCAGEPGCTYVLQGADLDRALDAAIAWAYSNQQEFEEEPPEDY